MSTAGQPAFDASAAAEARMESFREQLQSMRVPGAKPERDRLISLLAVAAMVAAVVIAVVAYFMSHGTSNALEQNDAIVLAILAATVGIIGVGLYVKKGVERLLRFWIARVTFEQSAQTDRLVTQNDELQRVLRELLRERDGARLG
ncbi:MAG: hypothetical protein HZB15_14090 [Actinobacteria bacterium]|nr:hypothetical protein [Actinomycetota bacterium]